MDQTLVIKTIDIDTDNKTNTVRISNLEVDCLTIPNCLDLKRSLVHIKKLVLKGKNSYIKIEPNVEIDTLVINANHCEIVCLGVVKNIIVCGNNNTISMGTKFELYGRNYLYTWPVKSISIIGEYNVLNDKGPSVFFVKRVCILGSRNTLELPDAKVFIADFEGASNTTLICSAVILSKHMGIPITSVRVPFFMGSMDPNNNNMFSYDVNAMDQDIESYRILRKYLAKVPGAGVLYTLKFLFGKHKFKPKGNTKVKKFETFFRIVSNILDEHFKRIKNLQENFPVEEYQKLKPFSEKVVDGNVLMIKYGLKEKPDAFSYHKHCVMVLVEMVNSLDEVPKEDIEKVMDIINNLEKDGYEPIKKIIIVAPVPYFERRTEKIDDRDIKFVLCPLDELNFELEKMI